MHARILDIYDSTRQIIYGDVCYVSSASAVGSVRAPGVCSHLNIIGSTGISAFDGCCLSVRPVDLVSLLVYVIFPSHQ